MTKQTKNSLVVQRTKVNLLSKNEMEYIFLTDIARYRNDNEPFSIINNWMRSRSTINFIGLWESLNNENFKPIEFERFKPKLEIITLSEHLQKLNQIEIAIIGNPQLKKLK